MASGHVSRIKRPNTWLHRPMLQNREESSCQSGAVHTWHLSDLPTVLTNVGYQGKSGSDYAGPTSRRTRQSRLPDREAARGRRGLDGRRAGRRSRWASFACIAVPVTTWAWLGIYSAWGVTRKFFGLLLAYRWGSLVRVGISLVSLGLVGTWWLLAETAIKPIIVG